MTGYSFASRPFSHPDPPPNRTGVNRHCIITPTATSPSMTPTCIAPDLGSTASQSGRLMRRAVVVMTISIDNPTSEYVNTRPSFGDSTVIATPLTSAPAIATGITRGRSPGSARHNSPSVFAKSGEIVSAGHSTCCPPPTVSHAAVPTHSASTADSATPIHVVCSRYPLSPRASAPQNATPIASTDHPIHPGRCIPTTAPTDTASSVTSERLNRDPASPSTAPTADPPNAASSAYRPSAVSNPSGSVGNHPMARTSLTVIG